MVKTKRKKRKESKKKKKQRRELQPLQPQKQLQKLHQNSLILGFSIFLIIIILIFGFLVLLSFFPNIFTFNWDQEKNYETKTYEESEFIIKESLINSTYVTTYLPAVDEEGNGIITLLVVEGIPGSGRTMVDIDNLLFWADTQHSIRIAKNVAVDISGVDADKYDLVYNIYANASIIGGESAGAAITIATIAILQNKTLSQEVIITGTINHDGTIGPVTSILPKAKAAKEAGANIFLVPLLQGKEIIYETREHCEKFGPTELCTIEQIPRRVNISEEAGITVKEVGTIEEALEYFLK